MNLRIANFGMARSAFISSAGTADHGGMMNYWAPEIAGIHKFEDMTKQVGARKTDLESFVKGVASDMWAFASVIYEVRCLCRSVFSA